MAHVRGRRLGTRRAALWWVGWHPLAAPVLGAMAGLVVGNAAAVPAEVLLGAHALATMAAATAAGAVAGVVAWYRGTATVNRAYGDVVASVGSAARDADGAVTAVLLGDGDGSRPLVEPNRHYDATVLSLGEDAVTVRRGRFDLADRRPVLDDAMAVPYDRVASVAYDGRALAVETTAGDRFRYAAASEPTDLVTALRDRTRDGR